VKFTLGFSPCPNDTFIFDALVNKIIDTEDLDFETVLEDVETLNQWALQGKLDITKLSLPAFFQSTGTYRILKAGSALGKGVGPLLISKKNTHYSTDKIEKSTVAIPGVNTTANLLLGFAFPGITQRIPMIFSDIENAVLSGKTELGVIIHENRFTYQQKGLHKVVDLGAYWEQKMKVPIPLGTIAMKRKFEPMLMERINGLIKQSVERSLANYPLITDYVRRHSQEMDEDVMRQHIELYVNDYSLDLGIAGNRAIEILHKVFMEQQSRIENISSSSNTSIS
jgi:5,8-dihydroxy-2-naphthoate synthase